MDLAWPKLSKLPMRAYAMHALTQREGRGLHPLHCMLACNGTVHRAMNLVKLVKGRQGLAEK